MKAGGSPPPLPPPSVGAPAANAVGGGSGDGFTGVAADTANRRGECGCGGGRRRREGCGGGGGKGVEHAGGARAEKSVTES